MYIDPLCHVIIMAIIGRAVILSSRTALCLVSAATAPAGSFSRRRAVTELRSPLRSLISRRLLRAAPLTFCGSDADSVCRDSDLDVCVAIMIYAS